MSIQKIDEPVIVKANPREVDLEIGSLVVRAEKRYGKIHAFAPCKITVDGKEMKVRRITIKGSVDSAWTCEMEFFP